MFEINKVCFLFLKLSEKGDILKFETVQIDLQPGDVISSKLGIVQHSSLSGSKYLVKKVKYVGNGLFMAIGDKTTIEVNKKER